MPDLSEIRVADDELRFAHAFVGGWVFAAIGCGMIYAATAFLDPGTSRWLMIGMGGVFAVIGAGGALWRYDLFIDPIARTYRGRRGFWPSPRRFAGSLDDLEGVSLTRSWRRGDDHETAVWVVNLAFRTWDKPVSIFETTREGKGYRKQEELARRLSVVAIDRTGESEIVRTQDELDRSVAERDRDQREAGFALPTSLAEPPSESGIELTRTEIGAPMIVLPAPVFSLAAALLSLFGLPFLGLGLLALASALGWHGAEVEGTLTAKWVVGAVFAAVGLLLQAAAIFGSVAREVVRQEDDAIVVTLLAFGFQYRRQRLPRREIEEITIKPSRSSRSRRRAGRPSTEVVVRTDDNVVRIAGDQPPDSQRWLVQALLVLARQ